MNPSWRNCVGSSSPPKSGTNGTTPLLMSIGQNHKQMIELLIDDDSHVDGDTKGHLGC